MVLGNYYLTLERKGATGEGAIFHDADEALIAYQTVMCIFIRVLLFKQVR